MSGYTNGFGAFLRHS